MPTFRNPKLAIIEPRGDFAPLAVLALVIVLIVSGVVWLVGELEKIQAGLGSDRCRRRRQSRRKRLGLAASVPSEHPDLLRPRSGPPGRR
jgi:hypothetical protein